jgi:hypothetical protein
MTRQPIPTTVETSKLTIRISGGNAETQRLPLNQYWLTLRGWNDFFDLASRIYARSAKNAEGAPIEASLEIRIVAERRGSFEVILGFILTGIIGNRADAAVVWTYKALSKWIRQLFNKYRDAKRRSTDVQQLVEALEVLTRDAHLSLLPIAEDLVANQTELDEISDDLDLLTNAFSAERLLLERLDTSVRDATTLLGSECELIELIQDDGKTLLKIDRDDYDDLHQPLTLPPPEGRWRHAKVRFERINIKTGKSLVYIDWQGISTPTTVHAKIVDTGLGAPRDPYTEALNRKETLKVWARQVRAERGRLNLMWEITVKPPEQTGLWDEPNMIS